MSILLVETLQDSLSQEISFNLENRAEIAAFIPYLYFHNVSGATFTFEIKKGLTVVFEQDFTSEEIRQSSGDYAHVFYPIIPKNPVQIEAGSYMFTIKRKSNYLAADTFIGWIKQYYDIQNEMSYIPENDNQNSFAIRFKKYVEGIKI